FGSYNTAIGINVLSGGFFEDTLTASYNTAIGYNALASTTKGLENVAIGMGAMQSNLSGGLNVAVGNEALAYSINGFNVAVGHQALGGFNNSGNENTALGYRALIKNTSAYKNIGLGWLSGSEITSGSENISIGYLSSRFLSSGLSNIFIGNNSGPDVGFGNITNSICLGNLQANNLSNQAVIGNASTAAIGGFQNWSNYSDGRMKTNVQENVPGLDFINKLRPVTYNRSVDLANKILGVDTIYDRSSTLYDVEKIRYTGLIAQEVEAAAQAINFDFSGVKPAKHDKDLYSVSYSELIMPLIKAVQELSQENELLKSKLNEVNSLKTEIQELKQLMKEKN
ncbi:MAG: hypothetical protein RLZZ546_2030, partial [Bacteroidota bacterium]